MVNLRKAAKGQMCQIRIPWLLQSQSRNLCAGALQAGGDVRNSDKTTRYAGGDSL